MAALARVLLNTARRFPYPFAPALARGLDVPLTAITSLVAVNQATGLLAPVLGNLADRHGPKTLMLAGLACLAGGMLAAGLLPAYAVVLAGLALAGLGKSCFDPALQAYVAERVPYARRGLAIGLVEVAWAASSLLGIPLAGLLIARLGWRAPFLALGGLGLVAMVLVAGALGGGRAARGAAPGRGGAWREVIGRRAARGALGYAFLFSMANDSLFVVYGAWLERDFQLGLVGVGAATTAIGVGELAGEGLTAALADRVGLRRAVLAGAALTGVAYLALPLASRTLPLALACLFLAFLAFEFTVVTGISLFTEVVPAARGTMMASVAATSSAGRVAGALLGGQVWIAAGLGGTAVAASTLTGLALSCLVLGFAGWAEPQDDVPGSPAGPPEARSWES